MKYIKKIISIFAVMAISIMLAAYGNSSKGSDSGSTESIKQEQSSVINDENSHNSIEDGDEIDNEKTSINIEGGLKVHFIDVGQADSILIQQGNENMLIDAGNNDDEENIKNYLNSVEVSEFKYVVGTHAHEDHIGSLDYIMNSFKVGKIYFPKTTATTKTFENLVKAVQSRGMQFTEPTVGETFNIGDAECTILAPNSSKYDDANNYSIVIKLQYGNTSFLFTGDAEDVSEKEMLKNGLDLKADVLKAGHHGSKSSSTDAFLDSVNPKYAVISVGKDNDYGHPNVEALNRLSSKGTTVYRTDLNGTVVATSDGNNITFNCNSVAGSTSVTYANNNSSNSTSSVIDKQNDSNSITVEQSQDKNRTVYVSRNNGKIYHYDKTCSGLKNTNEMTLEEAQNEGVRACSKCAK